MITLAVMASGGGSNFEALCQAFQNTPLFPRLLVCDQKGAQVFARAERLGVPAVHLPFSSSEREAAASRLDDLLQEQGINLIALAGFMKILPASFVKKWKGRLLNIHPSLLPRHPGTHAIEKAWNSGDKEFGITIHLVDEGVDTGPILHQNFFLKENSDTLESIEQKVHRLEHWEYPKVLQRYAEKNLGVNL